MGVGQGPSVDVDRLLERPVETIQRWRWLAGKRRREEREERGKHTLGTYVLDSKNNRWKGSGYRAFAPTAADTSVDNISPC